MYHIVKFQSVHYGLLSHLVDLLERPSLLSPTVLVWSASESAFSVGHGFTPASHRLSISLQLALQSLGLSLLMASRSPGCNLSCSPISYHFVRTRCSNTTSHLRSSLESTVNRRDMYNTEWGMINVTARFYSACVII